MPRITITVEDKTPQPYRFSLDRKLVTMGRGSENDIAVDCRSVSVNHAVMKRVPGGFKLRDMDSTNGTRLDGKKVTEIFLENGQEVKVGDVDFDFQLSNEELEMLADELDNEDESVDVIEDEAVESDAMEASEASEDDETPRRKRKRKEEVVRDEDGDEAEEDEKPRRKARSKTAVNQKKPAQLSSAAMQTLITIGWIVGAALAFYLGMSVRYSQNNEGSSLLRDLNHPPAQQSDDDGDDAKQEE